ncbi:hypothetical protein DL96DRAFT_1625163 [Flagelloscypha sp. PMI_526]|nr:hypothetical protein DL96DRAFT_1625163 [Flagelloscypha sp. PMI_526]
MLWTSNFDPLVASDHHRLLLSYTMPTPRAGTHQEQDLENLYTPYKKSWVSKYLKPTFWVVVFTVICCGYNIAACAIGRFFLDFFRLWKSTIPQGTPGIDKHAELIAAFVAGCLATPATFGFLRVLVRIDELLKKQGVDYQLLDHSKTILWSYVFMTWVLVLVTGAVFHLRFQHVSVVTMLAVFGFGSLLLVPTIGLLMVLVFGSWTLWEKWRYR